MNFEVDKNKLKGYLTLVYEYSVLDKEVEIRRKDLLGISEQITQTAFLINKLYLTNELHSSHLRGKVTIETESNNLEESDSGILTYRLEGQNIGIIRCVYGLIDQDIMPDYFVKPNIIRTTINDLFLGKLFKPKTDPVTYSKLEELFSLMRMEIPNKPEYNFSHSRMKNMT